MFEWLDKTASWIERQNKALVRVRSGLAHKNRSIESVANLHSIIVIFPSPFIIFGHVPTIQLAAQRGRAIRASGRPKIDRPRKLSGRAPKSHYRILFFESRKDIIKDMKSLMSQMEILPITNSECIGTNNQFE